MVGTAVMIPFTHRKCNMVIVVINYFSLTSVCNLRKDAEKRCFLFFVFSHTVQRVDDSVVKNVNGWDSRLLGSTEANQLNQALYANLLAFLHTNA